MAKTERAIDADVREPGEGDLNRYSAIGQHADCAQNERSGSGMGKVAGERADPRPGEKAEQREVNRNEQRDQGEDAVVEVEIDDERCCGEDTTLKTQQHAGHTAYLDHD